MNYQHNFLKALAMAMFTTTMLMAGLISPALAQPRESLGQLIRELQVVPPGSARDDELRHKIIAIATSMKSPPSISDEVLRHEGRAEAAVRGAKSAEDYLLAAAEYRKALLLAPWVAGDYYNLGVVLEKAGKQDGAISAYKYYLLAAPNADDARDVKKRIAGIEFELEKKAQPKIITSQETALKYLQSTYGTRPIGGAWKCMKPDGSYSFYCSDADAMGTNWRALSPVGSVSGDTSPDAWRKANRFFRFELQGEEIRLDPNHFDVVLCGKVPDSGMAADIQWRLCSDNAPARLEFVESNPDRRPGLRLLWDCGQAYHKTDECLRYEAILQ